MSVLSKRPVLIINLKDLKVAYEIVQQFHKMNPKIGKYIYQFRMGNNVLKYGISSNNDKEGDRAYRQAAHLPGWHKGLATSYYGEDMGKIVSDYNIKYNTFLHKDDVILTIWDMKDVTFDELRREESKTILEHVEVYNEPPIGNIEDYRKNLKPVVTTKHFDSLFVEE